MNEDIRKIVRGYIDDDDYEKALSLMCKSPLDDENDKSLYEETKTKFATYCTKAIADAVKTHDAVKAEQILQLYKKYIGEDANTELFQSLADGIVKEKVVSETTNKREKASFNLSEIMTDIHPNQESLRSKKMGILYLALGLIVIICGNTLETHVNMCIASVVMAVALAFPVLKSGNKKFLPIGLVLLLIPIAVTFITFGKSLESHNYNDSFLLPWLLSLLTIVVYNAVKVEKSWTIRILVSLFLFTILNPLWYGMKVPGGIEVYSVQSDMSEYSWTMHKLRFTPEAHVFVPLVTLCTLIIYYVTLTGTKRLWIIIKKHRKRIGIAIVTLIGICIVISVIIAIKDNHDQKIAEQKAIEQARLDSIKAMEQARIAAIEQARQDSINAIRRKEQARLDSIDYAEHAGFVAKYAKIGLIITEIRMMRGVDSEGLPTKGIKFRIFNPTHKTIKYVIANLNAVNKFNDRISGDKRCRGMGPVAPHEFGEWEFEDVFTDKNDVIDDISVSFQVDYTNGSSKLIRWTNAYVKDFKSSWFDGR